MATPAPIVVSGPDALAAFRQGVRAASILDHLERASGRLLIQLPVGVGKTFAIADLIRSSQHDAFPFDRVLVLLPRKDIRDELLARLPADLSRTVLTARPGELCGQLDGEWRELERSACGLLARDTLCSACPNRGGCLWRTQYGDEGLRDARLILAMQQLLVINPSFVRHLIDLNAASKLLVIIDESDLLLNPLDRHVTAENLRRFHETLVQFEGEVELSRANQRWLEAFEPLLEARDSDLREGLWAFPWIDAAWARAVQRQGRRRHGKQFNFLAYDLRTFSESDRLSRERLPDGGIRFATPPILGPSVIIFSGSIAKELARYRLDPNHRREGIASPFENYHFEHPDTRWYNISSTAGAAKNFTKNADAILHFFANLIRRNIARRKRTLLVAKKQFVEQCRAKLTDRLIELGVVDGRIVTGDWQDNDLTDPSVLPLISYGISGVNRFEHIDAAYCLTSYYVKPGAVENAVFEIEPSADRCPILIEHTGTPRRRRARVNAASGSILHLVAAQSFIQKEADVVVQAVGRVRPFTRPREIITFQASDLPGVIFTRDFATLGQARLYFELPTARRRRVDENVARALAMRREGRTNREIAAACNVDPRSVRRWIHGGGGHEPF